MDLIERIVGFIEVLKVYRKKEVERLVSMKQKVEAVSNVKIKKII